MADKKINLRDAFGTFGNVNYNQIKTQKEEDKLLSLVDSLKVGLPVDESQREAVLASIKNLDPKYVYTTPEGELAYIPEIGGVPQDLSDPSKIQAYQAVPDLSDIGQGDFGALAYYAPDVAEIALDMFGAKKLSQGILKPRTGRGGSFDTSGLLRSQLLRDFAGYGTASGLLNVGRQGVASLAADQDVADFDFNVAQPITNLVFSGGFGSIPNYLLSKKASNLENFALSDFDVSEFEDVIKARKNLSRKTGVPITAPEMLEAEGLLRRQKWLQEFPETTRKIMKFYKNRDMAQKNALTGWIESISPLNFTDSQAGMKIINAGQKALNKLWQNIRSQTEPLYDSAIKKSTIEFSEDQVKKNQAEIFKLYNDGGFLLEGGQDNPAFTLALKIAEQKSGKEMMGYYKTLNKAIFNNLGTDKAAFLRPVRELYAKKISEFSPDFKIANQKYAELAPSIDQFENSFLGKAVINKNTQTENLANNLFKKNIKNLDYFKEVKGIVNDFDKTGETWKGIVKTHLVDIIDEINVDDPAVNIYNKFVKATKLDNKKSNTYKALKESLGEEQMKRLDEFAEVLRLTNQVRLSGSPTYALQAGERTIKEELPLNKVTSLLRLDLTRPLAGVANVIERIGLKNYANKLLDLFLSDEETYKSMKDLYPDLSKISDISFFVSYATGQGLEQLTE